jgi:type II secretory ATPase GspE/PulE/Tfp pilus assembly ATPase PilB-like protein
MLPKNINKSGRLEDLGLNERQIHLLKDMLMSSCGLVIFTGPTGAGKSTLLKYALEWVQDEYPYSNTITVEDPVEYQIKHAKQIDVLVQDNEDPSINERALAWSRVISTTLRLDPDRLMISEIRDGGAAIAAFRAAQTGHLTLSTSHNNDGWESYNRLVDLLREGGMLNPGGLLANTKNFVGATAQRLIPCLCSGCKIPLVGNENRIGGKQSELYSDLVAAVENFPAKASGIYLRGDGCNLCVPEFPDRPDAQKLAPRAGVYGRTLVLEIVRPTQHHWDIAREEGTPAARRQWLEDGGLLMIDHAIEKVVAGIITPEIIREFVDDMKTSRQLVEAQRRERLPVLHHGERTRIGTASAAAD